MWKSCTHEQARRLGLEVVKLGLHKPHVPGKGQFGASDCPAYILSSLLCTYAHHRCMHAVLTHERMQRNTCRWCMQHDAACTCTKWNTWAWASNAGPSTKAVDAADSENMCCTPPLNVCSHHILGEQGLRLDPHRLQVH